MYDYIIIGAGFAGSVMAERLASIGKKILIIDKRPHVGGNAYDYFNDEGILCHKYGPHIFHTNSKEIFDYVQQFTEWRHYEHKVLASVDGQLVPLPINRKTVNMIYGTVMQNDQQVSDFLGELAEDIDVAPKNSEEAVTCKVGRKLFEKLFEGYTKKQWGVEASELDASVCARIPVRYNEDDRYFTDKFQGVPADGYHTMFANMLADENITVQLNTDYRSIVPMMLDSKIIYTGPIDEYFNCMLGKLPYRSLRFEMDTYENFEGHEFCQPAAQINFPNDHNFTRIVEFKQITGQKHPKTTICREFPTSEGEPYYPIPAPENRALYDQYKLLAAGIDNTYFIGRLASYKYYNMDQVIGQALSLFKKILDEK